MQGEPNMTLNPNSFANGNLAVEARNMHADLMGRLKVAVQSKLILEKQHAQCAMGGRTRDLNALLSRRSRPP